MLWTTAVFGMPRYVAIPLDDLETAGILTELIPEEGTAREGRQLEQDSQVQLQKSESIPEETFLGVPGEFVINDEARLKRDSFPIEGYGAGSGHHNTGYAVDYGAYTGNKGAFGWYADFPVFSTKRYHRR